jgi:hypothetical protein
MIIRDFYFGAWLIKEHGYCYKMDNGKLTILNIDKSTLVLLSKNYVNNHKDYYDCVKALVREANQSRTY